MKILAQVNGFFAVAGLSGSYQCKRSRHMFVTQLCSNLLYILHFLLLGAFTGCLSMAVNVARNIVLTQDKPWAKLRIWPWAFIAIGFLVAAITWDGPFSLFPAIATTAFTVSSFTRNGKKIRLINLAIGSPAWVIYDIKMHSWSGLLGECFCIVSVLVSIARYGLKALDIDE